MAALLADRKAASMLLAAAAAHLHIGTQFLLLRVIAILWSSALRVREAPRAALAVLAEFLTSAMLAFLKRARMAVRAAPRVVRPQAVPLPLVVVAVRAA